MNEEFNRLLKQFLSGIGNNIYLSVMALLAVPDTAENGSIYGSTQSLYITVCISENTGCMVPYIEHIAYRSVHSRILGYIWVLYTPIFHSVTFCLQKHYAAETKVWGI